MISPFGSETLHSLYIDDFSLREDLLKEAQSLPSIVISSSAAANAVMLGGGYFNPLNGFMNLHETLKVSESMQLDSGLFWPVPILNLLHDHDLNEGIRSAPKIALRDPNIEGNPVLAVQEVNSIEFISNEEKNSIINQVFSTEDPNHPGVASFSNGGNALISGPIQVLNFSYFSSDFPETFRTAAEIRDDIAQTADQVAHLSTEMRTFLGEPEGNPFIRRQRAVIRASSPTEHCIGPEGMDLGSSDRLGTGLVSRW